MANLSNLNNKFLVTTGGNVGINTTSPTQKLVVIGNIGTSGSVLFDDNQGINFGNSNAKIYGSSSDGIKFNAGGSEAMRLNQSGNLGIGVTPEAWTVFKTVQIGQSSAFVGRISSNQTDVATNFYYDGAEKRITTGYAQRYTQTSDGKHQFFTAGTDSADSAITFSNKFEIANDGTATFAGDLYVPNKLIHVGDTDTWIQFETNVISLRTGGTDRLTLTNTAATFSGNVISLDTFYLENGSGKRWQMLFDTNDFNLRYYNGSSWSADALAIDTSNNATFAGYVSTTALASPDGTQILYPANSGNIGIGTTSPAQKLDVRGGNIMVGGFGGGTDYGLILTPDDGSGYWNIANVTGGALTFNNSNTIGSSEAMRIIGGNVGIGTTSPNPFGWGNKHLTVLAEGTNQYAAVDIIGSGNAAGAILFGGGSGSGTATNIGRAQISAHDGSHLVFATNASNSGSSFTERMRITSAGNVGIGVTSPDNRLDIDSSFTNSVHIRGTGTRDLFSYHDSGGVGWATGSGVNWNNLLYLDSANNSIRLYTNGNERVRVNDSGNVGIGITPTATSKLNIGGLNSGYFVDLTCSGPGGSRAIRFIDGGTPTKYNWLVGAQHNVDNAFEITASTAVGGTTFNSPLFLVNQSGKVGIGTTAPQTPLHVNGGLGETIRVQGSSATGKNYIQFADSAGNIDAYIGLGSSTTDKFLIVNFTDEPTQFYQKNGIKMTITNVGDVGIGKTNPSTHLDVQGVITCGDSTTDGAIRRQHQTFATMKPGPSSGGNVDMMFVDHTHTLDVTVMAYINTSTVAVARGYSSAAYGSASAGFTQTNFSPNGTISAISLSYVNSGGSEAYILRVNVTYTGSTAPVISMTANGQSTSELRAAT